MAHVIYTVDLRSVFEKGLRTGPNNHILARAFHNAL